MSGTSPEAAEPRAGAVGARNGIPVGRSGFGDESVVAPSPTVAHASVGGPVPDAYSPANTYPAYGHAYPSPSSYPYAYDMRERGRAVGVVAFLVSLAVAILAPVATAAIAQGFAPFVALEAAGVLDTTTLTAAEEQQASSLVISMVALAVAATLFGLWGFVQGIVAAARHSDGGFGVAAICLAVLAPIACAIVFTATFSTLLPPELLQR